MNKLEGNVFEMYVDELTELVSSNVEGKEEFYEGNIDDACGTMIVKDLKKEFNKPENIAVFQQWVEDNDDYDEIELIPLLVGLQHMKKLSCNIDVLIITGF